MRARSLPIVLCAVLSLVGCATAARGAAAFADPAFQRQWVAGEAVAPNFWGLTSTATDGQQEPYREAGGGKRLVQYFDKGRMELTNGQVTNGLLATELVTGQIQVGDATFQTKPPPAIPIAGDADNPGPTYAALAGKAASLLRPTTARVGNPIVASVAVDGTVNATGVAGVTTNITTFDDVTQHNVSGVFASYRTTAGLQMIGYAISEPFLTSVKVAGARKTVLIQVFERRVLTYTPDNPPAFQLEMGNIGQHYYQWRYRTPFGNTTGTLSASAWKPHVATAWQIQYAALPIDLSVSAEMYDIDLFTTDPGTIASLHASGRRVACYFSAGSYEPYRPDSGQFPAAIRGKSLKGFADEQWLDIRRLDVLGPIMRARLELARQNGCDGVDPDNVDGYSNPIGYPLTAQDQLSYNRWLAQEAHARGLAIFLKNDSDQVRQLVDIFDGAVVEQCFEYDECEQYVPFVQAGKPVFEIEYNREPGAFCAQANALNFNSLYKHLSLDAYRVVCR